MDIHRRGKQIAADKGFNEPGRQVRAGQLIDALRRMTWKGGSDLFLIFFLVRDYGSFSPHALPLANRVSYFRRASGRLVFAEWGEFIFQAFRSL